MVRAIALVWLFSGLRMDEIRHTRVGCVRWQHETAVRVTAEVLPEGSVCWLDVPANKTSEGYPKPVDPLVGKAIETWEEIRPRQPALIDGRTAREAHYLLKLLAGLADVPTPSGPTPRQLGIVPLSAKPPPAEAGDST